MMKTISLVVMLLMAVSTAAAIQLSEEGVGDFSYQSQETDDPLVGEVLEQTTIKYDGEGICEVHFYEYPDEDTLDDNAYFDFDLGEDRIKVGNQEVFDLGVGYAWSSGNYVIMILPEYDWRYREYKDTDCSGLVSYFLTSYQSEISGLLLEKQEPVPELYDDDKDDLEEGVNGVWVDVPTHKDDSTYVAPEKAGEERTDGTGPVLEEEGSGDSSPPKNVKVWIPIDDQPESEKEVLEKYSAQPGEVKEGSFVARLLEFVRNLFG
ncbi:MAG: hypothetical protein KJ709_00965 [Nanoarchaeota archaeon]|nr:hypothetical protein [Nanoarchaeota archaeon]